MDEVVNKEKEREETLKWLIKELDKAEKQAEEGGHNHDFREVAEELRRKHFA